MLDQARGRFSMAPHDRKVFLGSELPFRSTKQAMSFAAFSCTGVLLVTAAALLCAPGLGGMIGAAIVITGVQAGIRPVLHSMLPVKLTIDCEPHEIESWRRHVEEQIVLLGYHRYRTEGNGTMYFRMNVPRLLQWEQIDYQVRTEGESPEQHLAVVGSSSMVDLLRRKLEANKLTIVEPASEA